MHLSDIDKSYVSPEDEFLHRAYASSEKTASQQKEINKHKKIADKRDNSNTANSKSDIWEEF